jgi:hypothetical protein
VILFGAHSCFLSGLDLSLRLPFTQQVKNGSFFLLLPAWSELVAKRELQEHSLTYLQAAFSSLPGLR